MEIETKPIWKGTIKPSSPTPKSLQKYQLSFLDQRAFTTFIPFVYFYTSNPKFSDSLKSKQLKKSLSEVLSIYYPLAGRIVANLYVDCNDAGVPFSEAQADCDVSQFITNPNPKNLEKFLPRGDFKDHCLAVHVTYFRCGGLAVGMLLSHKVADGLSLHLFVSNWSNVARNGGSGNVPLPKFDAAYAPPLDSISLRPAPTGFVEEEVARKILTFPAAEIAAIQERYTDGGHRPSRVEALRAFIWARYSSIRSDPTGDGVAKLMWNVREASKALDAGYVGGLKKRETQLEEIRDQVEASKVEERFLFSNVCGFPLYEADFGWGEPDRVRFVGLPYKNMAFFMDTKSGDGIEVLLQLSEQDMEKFLAHSMLKSNL
ncbi:vinorine synthase-like isoform X2 [Salvia hispanica]|uniref:vinorine synthase-like isoform X2 n=1 Tax=Salvia hispanica TaxID=49212 RepID=UPI002008F217|nr:vinorine synthase-like isoform X2 [Salvia hispanica]